MKPGLLFTILGSGLTLAVAGVAFIIGGSQHSVSIGLFFILLGFLAPSLIVFYYRIKELQVGGLEQLNEISSKLEHYTTNLTEAADRLDIKNDARFIQDGFIGLQKQSFTLDANASIGDDFEREAVLGHLPSYMRIKHITQERGEQLYHNWEPPHLIEKYVQLINQRRDAFFSFLEKGGIAREIYSKSALTEYVQHGFTFHDRITDPIDEIKERLEALLNCLSRKNYYLCLLDEAQEGGPYYLLAAQKGLLLDLRTTETERHFTNSFDGLYTESPTIIEEFMRKFRLTWESQDKKINEEFIRGLLTQIHAHASI